MNKIYLSGSARRTQKLGKELAKVALNIGPENRAVILGLYGDLGTGKTTFLQGFATGLGIKEKILSPTYVILKKFPLKGRFSNFYHIDCYRLKNGKSILELDFKDIIKNPQNVIAIEWPEKIKSVMPEECIKIKFHSISDKQREIIIET